MTTDIENIVETPTAEIPWAVRSDDWSDRLWNFGCYAGRHLDSIFTDFGMLNPNYVQTFNPDDGHERRAFPRGGGHVPTPAQSFACPLALRPGTGTDRQATVLLKAGGYVNYWEISTPTTPGAFNPFDPCSQWSGEEDVGFNMELDACVGTVEVVPTNEHGNASTMSPAVPMNVSVARLKDAAAGRFPYALAMTVSRNCGMSGPVAPPSIADVEDPSIGTKYRAACSPARFLTPSTTAPITQGIPEAMRFAIVITDAEIQTWLDSRGYTGALRQTAQIFAVALRDFGLILTAFGGTATIITDGDKNWSTLGITKNVDLLHGLITRERLYALRPPVSTDAAGKTWTRECNAVGISY